MSAGSNAHARVNYSAPSSPAIHMPGSGQTSAQPRPTLRVIEGTKGQLRQSAFPALLAALVLFASTIVVPLILNTSMASLAYEIRDQRIELAQTQAEIDSLEAKLRTVSSTSHLREQATKNGLVPVGPIGVISLERGTVEGGVPASGGQ